MSGSAMSSSTTSSALSALASSPMIAESPASKSAEAVSATAAATAAPTSAPAMSVTVASCASSCVALKPPSFPPASTLSSGVAETSSVSDLACVTGVAGFAVFASSAGLPAGLPAGLHAGVPTSRGVMSPSRLHTSPDSVAARRFASFAASSPCVPNAVHCRFASTASVPPSTWQVSLMPGSPALSAAARRLASFAKSSSPF
mmetsp:Transcript_42496/g.74556  ORF Transcript_42496/g.74556 Transcript_42496/m.74556 type:complete len:202 (-) Transcript_42496:266-871(-)